MYNADIEEELWELYDFHLLPQTFSVNTARVNEDILDWQNRPLVPLYRIVWMDGIVLKVTSPPKNGYQ